jgi:hypothetical protein
MKHRTRRSFVRKTSAISVLALAGCSALPNSTPSPSPTPEYEYLGRTPTYLSDDIGLRLPERVPRAETPTNADLIVLHGIPPVDAEKAVTWLAAGHRVALLGDRAQQTWVTWTQSETYLDTFDEDARGQSEPAPHLLVAAAKDKAVTTSRFTWGDLPSNSELVQSLDEALSDIATWTPD